jgi:hypothetical protein
MTPASQHTYSVASVSYLGLAYADCQASPKAPTPPPAQPSKAGGQNPGH